MCDCDCVNLLSSDQREAGAADGEKEGDDVQVGRQMGLAEAPWVTPPHLEATPGRSVPFTGL